MLPQAERLRRASLFQRVYSAKKSIHTPFFTLYVLPREPRSRPKLPLAGFVVSKKVVNKATGRNLVKRRLREAYRRIRLEESGLNEWYAIIFVVHDKALTAEFEELAKAVKESTAKASTKYGQADRMQSPRKQFPSKQSGPHAEPH